MTNLVDATVWILRAAALVAIAALAFELRGLRAPVTDRAPARGSALKGSTHFFTVSMLPHKKESASRHLPSFSVGVVFHGAAFIALALLIAPLQWPGLVIPLGAGFAASVYLVGRRVLEAGVRGMSGADDYISASLVGVFILSAAVRVLSGSASFAVAHNLMGSALLLYMPFGKLRHWLYFFLARGLFGLKLGRRGIVGA